ncbi:MAG: VCBS repeat-containing protein [Verrucomicrobia bacterium]|nr:VCBS repeat-containing protein [Verrucomicrobiota bacterium]
MKEELGVRLRNGSRAFLLGLFLSIRQAGPVYGAIEFTNVTAGSGYNTDFEASYWYVVPADCDADGDQDVFVMGHYYEGHDPTRVNLVFRNDGGLQFTDITTNVLLDTRSGNGAFPLDVDGNGLEDIVVSADQIGVYAYLARRSSEFGFSLTYTNLEGPGWHYAAAGALGDLNGDGRLDLFAGHHHPSYADRIYQGSSNLVFQYDDELTGRLAALSNGASSVLILDLNEDGRSDVYYSEFRSDVWAHDLATLYYADPVPGSFTNVSGRCGIPWDVGVLNFFDMDNDADLDVLADGRAGLRLFRNNGAGAFAEVTAGSGLEAVSPTTDKVIVHGDFNLDGSLDLVIRDTVYVNDGTGEFSADCAIPGGSGGRWTAADLDDDGDLDLISPSGLWRNDSTAGGWLEVEARGDVINPSAVGAKIRIYQGGHLGDVAHLEGYRQVTAGVRNNEPLRQHFGVSTVCLHDVEVLFPSGKRVARTRLPSSRRVRITEQELEPAFTAAAEPAGEVAVALYPTELVAPGAPMLVTFGLPLPRESLRTNEVNRIRVLDAAGEEIPACVHGLTPWYSLADTNPAAYVRVARIQFQHTFSGPSPTTETVRVEWGRADRLLDVPGVQDPRLGWHVVSSGTFEVADGISEPDVYAVLPKEHLCKGLLKPTRMFPFHASVAAARSDPEEMKETIYRPGTLTQEHAQKNNFFTIINEDDPAVAGTNLCPYKTVYDTWLYDRASALFVLYFRSGFLRPLREAVRAAQFYNAHIGEDGFFDLKETPDAKYVYPEGLAYCCWLLGDEASAQKIPRMTTNALADVQTRWSDSMNFWTERHTAFKLLANSVAFELFGDPQYSTTVTSIVADVIWHQDGADGAIPEARVDGGLYHYGRQHDSDWDDNEFGASPWMSALLLDAVLRAYALTADPELESWARRLGNFLRAATTTMDDIHGDPMHIGMYAMLYDGQNGNPEEDTTEHSLETVASLAWSHYFSEKTGVPDGSLFAMATNIYRTYELDVDWWLRPAGPEYGLPAFRVSPWRKYAWEHRPSGSLSWLLGPYFDSDDDGLTDYDERGHVADPFVFDTDGDGLGDGDEVRAGTDPADSDSCFKIVEAVSLANDNVSLIWLGGAGLGFTLEYGDDLRGPLTNCYATVVGHDSGTNVLGASLGTASQRFFRVLVTPPE